MPVARLRIILVEKLLDEHLLSLESLSVLLFTETFKC